MKGLMDMAIRIRKIGGRTIALCAARSVPQAGDTYLDDEVHHALTAKFARDFNLMHECDLPQNDVHDQLNRSSNMAPFETGI